MSCELIGRFLFSAFFFKASNRCDSIRRYPVSRSVETTIWFSSFSFTSQRDSVPACVRDIVVSLYLAFSVHARFLPLCLFFGWLMHASHMLSCRICSGPLTICFCYVILRNKTARLIEKEISEIQRASRVSSRGSVHSQWKRSCSICSLILLVSARRTLSRLRRTLSLIDRRRSDGGIGTCIPLEKEYGHGRWFWRPQTHTYLERKRCQVGIIP